MLTMTPAAILSPLPPEATESHPRPHAGQACPSSLLGETGERQAEGEEVGFLLLPKGLFDFLPLPLPRALV